MQMQSFNTISRTKQELQQLLSSYQQAIDTNAICSVTDLKGTILYVNKKFCEISKHAQEELLKQNHRIINSGFHTIEFFKQMWKTIGKGNVWTGEIRNKAKDGTFYWVDTVIFPIKNKKGKIIQYFSIRMPITEKKKAEDERKKYASSLKEMLFMTSHRVRQPVANCLGLMALLEKDNPLTKKELGYIVEHFKSSALELDKFIKELTAFMYELEKKYETKTQA